MNLLLVGTALVLQSYNLAFAQRRQLSVDNERLALISAATACSIVIFTAVITSALATAVAVCCRGHSGTYASVGMDSTGIDAVEMNRNFLLVAAARFIAIRCIVTAAATAYPLPCAFGAVFTRTIRAVRIFLRIFTGPVG
jgi:hypothetical protein